MTHMYALLLYKYTSLSWQNVTEFKYLCEDAHTQAYTHTESLNRIVQLVDWSYENAAQWHGVQFISTCTQAHICWNGVRHSGGCTAACQPLRYIINYWWTVNERLCIYVCVCVCLECSRRWVDEPGSGESGGGSEFHVVWHAMQCLNKLFAWRRRIGRQVCCVNWIRNTFNRWAFVWSMRKELERHQ